MTLEQYLRIMLKHWGLIVICFVLVGAGTYVGSSLMTAMYQSQAIIEVAISGGGNVDYYSSLLASDQLVQTEATLATSYPVLREVALHYPGLSVDQLSKVVTASPIVNTQLFEIDVRDPSPQHAAVLANDIAVTLINQQNQLLQQDLPRQGSFLLIAQSAQPAIKPVSPNKPLYTGAGLLTGLLLGMLLALLFEMLDTRVRTPEAISQLLEWPMLATIRRATPKEGVLNPAEHDPNVEAYRILRTNIGFAAIDKPLHTLVVTSASPGEGKSVVSANLAIFMARAGKSTLLVDADLRRPVQHEQFAFPAHTLGFSNAVLAFSAMGVASASSAPAPQQFPPATPYTTPSGALGFSRTISLQPFIHAVDIPNLRVMPAGTIPPNPAELLDSKAMQRFLAALGTCGADVVIFDTPPLLGLSDARTLVSKTDGTLIVVDINCATKRNLKQVKALLEQAGANALGCVVNKQRRREADLLYAYYYNGAKPRGRRGRSEREVDPVVFSPAVSESMKQPEPTPQSGMSDITIKRELPYFVGTERPSSLDGFDRREGREHESSK